jgi:hypothetical protein
MSDLALSKAIHEATLFLEQIHADVRSLLTTLTDLLGQERWRSVYDGKVSWYLAPKLEGGWCWVLHDAWLLFLPQACKDSNSDRLIALSGNFKQPEGAVHAYATFAASIVRFPIKVDAEAVWEDWEPNHEVYKACLGKDEPVTLSLDKFTSWSGRGRAANVATIILPLSTLTDADVLRKKVVIPLLNAEKTLGAKS